MDLIQLPPVTNGFQILTDRMFVSDRASGSLCYFAHAPATDSQVSKMLFKSTGNFNSIGVAIQTSDGGFKDGIHSCSITQDDEFVFATMRPDEEVVMPTGVALGIRPNAFLMFRFEVSNQTGVPIDLQAGINFETYNEPSPKLASHMLLGFNTSGKVPAASGGVPGTLTMRHDCAVEPDAKFFSLVTQTKDLGTRTAILDRTTLLGESSNWLNPETLRRSADPFLQFASGKVTYECSFANTTQNTIDISFGSRRDGCLTAGYFFGGNKQDACFGRSL
jgi:hypothetical protein